MGVAESVSVHMGSVSSDAFLKMGSWDVHLNKPLRGTPQRKCGTHGPLPS